MIIRRGIGEDFRSKAAKIYWSAFQNKLGFALGSDDRAIRFFEMVMVSDQALIAYDEDQLLGLVGFDTGTGGVFGGGFKEIWKIYRFSAIWRYLVLALFTRLPIQNNLQIDGIAVAEHARGQGIGTALLNALYALAEENKLATITLEVVNNNPRARALYEREGFEAINTNQTSIFAPILGFQAATLMQKTL